MILCPAPGVCPGFSSSDRASESLLSFYIYDIKLLKHGTVYTPQKHSPHRHNCDTTHKVIEYSIDARQDTRCLELDEDTWKGKANVQKYSYIYAIETI